MKKFIRFGLVALVLLSVTTVTRPANALSGKEIDTTYYDACRDEIYERVIGCYGETYTWGTSSAGAVYKNISTLECEGSGYTSTWYQWNGSGWTMLSGMPPHC